MVILMVGLIFVAIPAAHIAIGGFSVLQTELPQEFFSLTNVSFILIVNWAITIIPIWFVGMTLCQRIYACSDVKTAKKAWYIAGFLEYPVMAFMGVILGIYAKVAFELGMFTDLSIVQGANIDSEMAMPLLLKSVLPTGLLGLVLAQYFSAILSTADSCLMASSGSVTTDLLKLKDSPRLVSILKGQPQFWELLQ